MNDDYQALQAIPWEQVLMDVTKHVRRRMRRFYWQGYRDGLLPQGLLPEDVTHEALLKFLNGTRVWKGHKYPTLFDFLCGVADSELVHLACSWENRKVQNDAHLSEAARRKLASRTATIDDLWEILEELSDGVTARFEASLANDDLLYRMVASIRAGTYLRRELARELEVRPADIDNAHKRLQRRWVQFKSRQARERRQS